jgi:signal peptidase I
MSHLNWYHLSKKFLPKKTGSLIALLIGAILLVSRSYVVHGQSMEPTLSTNDHIVTEKISYLFTPLKRGDVVIIGDGVTGGKQFVKRVIGVSNETVTIRDGLVYINDKLIQETYPLNLSIKNNHGPVSIPPGYVFVLGDNRDNSKDSRDFGPVSIRKIRGRLLFSYWPLTSIALFG